MLKRLYVGGIAFSTSNDRLREVFAEAGTVESVMLVTDEPMGHSRGFGFVEMGSPEAAQAAIKKLNRVEIDGRRITVQLAGPVRVPAAS
ncbi:MAG TPA: RNA-binding protein [Methylomirabilota bacterium]|jgi:RNA recognition motif-containing protein|nr:RNA-binding protein [Methylomirabilota bacterium]